jgi:hypothetical protein
MGCRLRTKYINIYNILLIKLVYLSIKLLWVNKCFGHFEYDTKNKYLRVLILKLGVGTHTP